jgi:serine/threonine-protein kinase
MVRFLRFVVTHALEHAQEPLKEYVIALEAFDKTSDFDPKADPLVRVEARRLRSKLREYYADEGRADRLLIALPDRGYIPTFEWHSPAQRAVPVIARRRQVIAAAVGLALLAGVGGWFVSSRSRGHSTSQKRIAIAVLPFVDVSSTDEHEYLADGLTDELIGSLSTIEGVDVIARTSVFQFKGRAGDVRTIARKLNVQQVLEGSLRTEAGTARVTARLIDVSSGFQIWSQTLERKITSVLEIQQDIARGIADRLRVENAHASTQGGTTNPEAYNLYLRGRHAWFHFTGPEARKSIDFFQQAVTLDPGFAAAHAELAFAYLLATDTLALPGSELLPKARLSAAKALDADPRYAEAHTAMAGVKVFLEWDWKGAEREFRRALELNPNSHRARFDYPILYLRPVGRFAEAVSGLRRVLESDPVSPFVNAFLGKALVEAGQHDAALAHLKPASELDPNYGLVHASLAEAYVGKSMCNEALRAYERSRLLGVDSPYILGNLGYVHGRCGDRAAALRLLGQLSDRKPPPLVDIAKIHAGLGDKDRAFESLARAVDQRYSQLVFLRGSVFMGELRSDPRFDRLLFETLGLPR